MRDGRLYARGAADDKGQVFCLLKAYEAVLDADGRPPLNVRFIFEGEEESGGRVISDLLRSRARADPGGCGAGVRHRRSTRPAFPRSTPRFAGICYAEISVRTLAAGPALRHLRRRRAQRDRDAGPHPRGAQGRGRRDPDSQALQGGRAAHQGGAQGLEASCRSTRRPSSATRSPAKALTGLKEYSVFERIWALPDLRDSRHPGRLRRARAPRR